MEEKDFSMTCYQNLTLGWYLQNRLNPQENILKFDIEYSFLNGG